MRLLWVFLVDLFRGPPPRWVNYSGCPRCDGLGLRATIWDSEAQCRRCGGTGTVREAR